MLEYIKPDKFYEIYNRIKHLTMLDQDRLFIIYQLVVNNNDNYRGVFAEVGVYKGGSSKFVFDLSNNINNPFDEYQLYDTFEGMPKASEFDKHKEGDLKDTSLESVSNLFKNGVTINKGRFPETVQLDCNTYKLVHVDCDIYQSVKDCCEFFYSRMLPGGVIVFDDYGFPSCPGAKKAVDEFFIDKIETPIYIPTGQCLVFKR